MTFLPTFVGFLSMSATMRSICMVVVRIVMPMLTMLPTVFVVPNDVAISRVDRAFFGISVAAKSNVRD